MLKEIIAGVAAGAAVVLGKKAWDTYRGKKVAEVPAVAPEEADVQEGSANGEVAKGVEDTSEAPTNVAPAKVRKTKSSRATGVEVGDGGGSEKGV